MYAQTMHETFTGTMHEAYGGGTMHEAYGGGTMHEAYGGGGGGGRIVNDAYGSMNDAYGGKR